MIRTISPQDMREMERAFLEGTGYPSILLMEHAAQAVVDALSAYAKAGSRVLFVCGSGNNGGDGCAAARLWMQRGGQADVWLLKSPSQMKGDAGVNACLLNSCGASLNVLYNEAPEVPKDCAAIVDALYGTGLSRELSGAALAAVQRMNESGLPVVAADIPSGVDGATGVHDAGPQGVLGPFGVGERQVRIARSDQVEHRGGIAVPDGGGGRTASDGLRQGPVRRHLGDDPGVRPRVPALPRVRAARARPA